MSGPQQRSVKVDPVLWDAVVRAAERAGRSTSEWVREALRARLGFAPGADRPPPGGGRP